MKTTAQTATERFRLLIEQLGTEYGRKRGWKAEAARRLRVHPSYVSRILNEPEISLGNEAIERAINTLALDPRFFYDQSLVEPHYSDFVSRVVDPSARPRRDRGTSPLAYLDQDDPSDERPLWANAVHQAIDYLMIGGAADEMVEGGDVWKLMKQIDPTGGRRETAAKHRRGAAIAFARAIEELPAFYWFGLLETALKNSAETEAEYLDGKEGFTDADKEIALRESMVRLYAGRCAAAIMKMDIRLVNSVIPPKRDPS